MAVIQKIRNRAGLLVAIIIGMALLAFILGDMLTSGSALLSKKKANVAVINGKSVSINEFQQLITQQEDLVKMQMGTNTLDEKTSQQVKQQAWNDLVSKLVMEREYDKLGLTVSGDELYDLVNGSEPHPYIVRFFADPNTGIVNHMALNQFLQNIKNLDDDNEQKQFWFYLEDMIYKERENTKYNNLLSKGFYTTSLEADKQTELLNTSVDFSYVVKRYNEISDSTVKISESDIKKYYKDNEYRYKQEKTRDIRFVYWDVVPSDKDIDRSKEWINEIKEDFISTEPEKSEQFASRNSSVPPNMNNLTKEDISDENIAEFAFNAELGEVYGPYFEDESYKLTKLAAINYLPDSVKASHILFSANQNSNFQAIKSLADSVKTLIENGANFADLAAQYSDDKSNAKKGGDLGWFTEGRMVKPFNDSCFFGKKGDIKIVYSQFGLHIIRIEDQSTAVKKVQLATITHNVQVSNETDQLYFAKATEFRAVNNTAKKFNEAIKADGINKRTAVGIKETDNSINGLDNSRDLIRWAFKAKKGEITDRVMQFDNKYVIAILDDAKEEGIAPLEQVKTGIEISVRKEKKAEKLKAEMNEKLNGVNDINALASALNTSVKQSSNVKFTSIQIPNLGREPEVSVTAVATEKGAITEPIIGENGVYVLQVNNKSLPEENIQNTNAKSFMTRNLTRRVMYTTPRVLNELAEIEDNRINFF